MEPGRASSAALDELAEAALGHLICSIAKGKRRLRPAGPKGQHSIVVLIGRACYICIGSVGSESESFRMTSHPENLSTDQGGKSHLRSLDIFYLFGV